ncbi:MAG: SDR family NAD(P)-dependent oxidoreductase [Sphingomonadales bacterium]|nr:SDR family NAD(P)-dependent oxidoreductase [Sphingomonadales bacterium]
MKAIAGKTAFVTGGASGIGLAIGRSLAARGCRVALADIDRDALDAAVAGSAGDVIGLLLDVRDRQQWADARAAVEAAFGPVGILANNAGIMNEGNSTFGDRGLIDQSPESFDRMIDINLVGVFNGIRTFGPGMADRREGHIVNTSSTQGVITSASVGAYCAAKFGVVAMSESLRQELARFDVGVSVLCPGVIETNLANSTNRLVGLPAVALPKGFGMDAAHVGEMVVQGILADRLYIFTHGEYIVPVAQRHARMLAALAETPISPLFNPAEPIPGTPEFADKRARMQNPLMAEARG